MRFLQLLILKARRDALVAQVLNTRANLAHGQLHLDQLERALMRVEHRIMVTESAPNLLMQALRR